MAARYDAIGQGYAATRRTDQRWADQVWAALGSARSVVNVGAGAGSYEPDDRRVVAVEPSWVMLEQRGRGAAPAVQANAEALPFSNASFDAAMAMITIHHWADPMLELREMVRVARHRVMVLTWDQPTCETFWLVSEYVPEIVALDRTRAVPCTDIAAALGQARIVPLLVPADCTDGALGAFWQRPQAYLDPAIRAGISGFRQIPPAAVQGGIERLADDLASGAWDHKFGHLRNQAALDVGYRLIVAEL